MADPRTPPSLTQDDLDRLARQVLSDPALLEQFRRDAELNLEHGPMLVLDETETVPVGYSGLVVIFDATPDPAFAPLPKHRLTPYQRTEIQGALAAITPALPVSKPAAKNPADMDITFHGVAALAIKCGSTLTQTPAGFVLESKSGKVVRQSLPELMRLLRVQL